MCSGSASTMIDWRHVDTHREWQLLNENHSPAGELLERHFRPSHIWPALLDCGVVKAVPAACSQLAFLAQLKQPCAACSQQGRPHHSWQRNTIGTSWFGGCAGCMTLSSATACSAGTKPARLRSACLKLYPGGDDEGAQALDGECMQVVLRVLQQRRVSARPQPRQRHLQMVMYRPIAC